MPRHYFYITFNITAWYALSLLRHFRHADMLTFSRHFRWLRHYAITFRHYAIMLMPLAMAITTHCQHAVFMPIRPCYALRADIAAITPWACQMLPPQTFAIAAITTDTPLSPPHLSAWHYFRSLPPTLIIFIILMPLMPWLPTLRYALRYTPCTTFPPLRMITRIIASALLMILILLHFQHVNTNISMSGFINHQWIVILLITLSN